jgi:hypothetical protein
MRFWVSWISGNYFDEGCTHPPIQYWLSGQMDRRAHLPQKDSNGEEKDDCTLCAVIDAESEDEVWQNIAKYFPDYAERFIEERAPDYEPGDRFLSFENRTRFNTE